MCDRLRRVDRYHAECACSDWRVCWDGETAPERRFLVWRQESEGWRLMSVHGDHESAVEAIRDGCA